MLNRIAVVIPAHDEEALLPGCLRAVADAVAHAGLTSEVIVVADACGDRTGNLARSAGATVVRIDARNVGAARATGCDRALRRGPGGLILAFTDADTLVPIDWLARHAALLGSGDDVVAGVVSVADWSPWSAALPGAYDARYQRTGGHVHGANLALTADAYLRAGGFPPLRTGEDQALVDAAVCAGLRVRFADDLSVVCSARRHARAPDGFSGYLRNLATELEAAG